MVGGIKTSPQPLSKGEGLQKHFAVKVLPFGEDLGGVNA